MSSPDAAPRTRLRFATAACLLVVAGLFVSACGSEDYDPNSEGVRRYGAPEGGTTVAERGGAVEIGAAERVADADTDNGGAAAPKAPRPKRPRRPKRGKYKVLEVTGGGTIKGLCKLDQAANMKPVPVSKDQVNCKHAEHASERVTFDPQTLALANCVVYLADIKEGKAFVGDLAKKGRQGLLDQQECKYIPHVMGIRTKTQVAVKNSDTAEHNIKAVRNRNSVFNLLQPSGGFNNTAGDAFLSKTGVYELKCDIHPWMNGYIHVFNHPYFAVTGKDGRFEFTDVPAGTYTIVCWHEGMSEVPQFAAGGEISGYSYGPAVEADRKVTVEAGGSANVEFVVPAPR